jgi:hypothetical protein
MGSSPKKKSASKNPVNNGLKKKNQSEGKKLPSQKL